MDPFADNNAYELSNTNPSSASFFDTLSQVQNSLSKYESHLDKLSQEQHNENSNNISSLSNEIRSITSSIKYQFEQLESHIIRSDNDQIRQYNNALSRFRKLVLRESQLDTNYQHQLRERGVQEYQILKPDATYEEALNAVDDFSGSDSVFANPLLVEKSQYSAEMQNRIGEASAVFDEIKNRHQELLKVSNQVNQLNMLLQDMQDLVVEQDVLLDSANDHYKSAEVDFERGDANVIKARDHAKKGRKWRWILLCCIIVLICVIVGVVVGLVKGLSGR